MRSGFGNPRKGLAKALRISRRSFLRAGLGAFLVSGLGVGRGVSNTSASRIVVERVEIPVHGLPSAFHGFKIALLSDLHASPLVSREHLAMAARLAREQTPDLVALTGDFIGHTLRTSPRQVHGFDPVHLDDLSHALAALQPPHGIYAVLGNHDFWSGPAVTRALVERLQSDLGVQWLRNRSVRLSRAGEELTLLGVDDYWQSSFSLADALRSADGPGPKILLSHNPEVNHHIRPGDGIALVLSGHTHGGQVAFPFIGTPFHPGISDPRYIRGVIQDHGRYTYVTRGVGHLLVPIRFNCPPEVSLITLVSGNAFRRA